MQSSIVLLALLGCALAMPQQNYIPVIARSFQSDPSGQFSSSYQSGDGAVVQETGALKPTNDGLDQVIVKQGSFAYTSPEGIPVSISYTADEYGFHPQGNVIPVASGVAPPSF